MHFIDVQLCTVLTRLYNVSTKHFNNYHFCTGNKALSVIVQQCTIRHIFIDLFPFVVAADVIRKRCENFTFPVLLCTPKKALYKDAEKVCAPLVMVSI
jgi:hypothetical protein